MIKVSGALRRIVAGALVTLAFGCLAPAQAQKPDTVRIGYQKSSTLLTILKTRGTLEDGLAPLGVKVQWAEFTSGLPLLEALNIGAIDLSADVADTVPLFAQAAGARLTYVAQEAPSPSAQGIVVKTVSTIKSVADLKGRKIAVTKAAGAHYLLIATLEKAGLKFRDVTPAYLTPADGRAALESGSVDAWVTWDPFLTAVEAQAPVRLLSDGRGIADYQRYYLASTRFSEARPDVLAYVFEQLRKTGEWVKQNPAEAAAALAPAWRLEAAIVEKANSHRSYAVRLVTRETLSEQQRIADAFLAEGLLTRRIDALDVTIWKP